MKVIALLIFLILLGILLLRYIVKRKKGYRIIASELFWIFFPWLICFALYYFGGINYTYELDIKCLLYIVLFLFSFILGRKIARLKKIGYIKENIDIEKKKEIFRKKINLKPLFYLSLVSVIGYTIVILVNNNIVFGVTRNINTNALSTILLLISNVSLIVWLYELSYSLINDTKIPLYAYFSIIIYCIPQLLISGRDAIMILIISTGIVFFYSGNYGIKELDLKGTIYNKVKKIILIFVVIILFYFIFLTGNRYGNDMVSLFEWSTESTFSEELLSVTKSLGSVGELLLNAIFYYSSQFSKLSFVFQNYEGPHLFGLYQLHYVSRRLPESWNLDYSIVVNEVRDLTNQHGVSGLHSIWDTAIGYSIYDFGRFGALFFAFLCGFLIGKVRNKFDIKKNNITIIYQVMICTGMFITVQISPIFNMSWTFPLIWLIFIDKFYSNKKNRGI